MLQVRQGAAALFIYDRFDIVPRSALKALLI